MKVTGLMALCGIGIFLSGCNLFPSESGGGGTPRLGRLTIMLQIGSDGRNFQPALGKTPVTLSRVLVILTSMRGEVVRDTITAFGSRLSLEPAYLRETSEVSQELQLHYELKPSSRWEIRIKVMDIQDSVRYTGTLSVEDLDAFQYLDGVLPLEPAFAAIEGRFRPPAAIESDGIPGSSRGLRAVYLTRLALVVDSAILTERRPYDGPAAPGDLRFVLADPAKLKGAVGMRFFRPVYLPTDPTIVISHNYGNALNNQYTVSAFGYVQGDTVGVTPERLLFQGTRWMDLTTAKVSVSTPVVMTWMAKDAVPVQINEGFDVRLGRVGKLVIKVIVPSAVDII